MARIDRKELKRQMETGELASLYLIAGEEKAMVRKAAQALIDRAAGDSFPDFNRNELEGSCEVDSIIVAATGLPFMAERKCVAVKDLDIFSEAGRAKELFELLDDLPETTTLVLWFPTFMPAKAQNQRWQELLRRAEKVGHVLLCQRLSREDLARTLTVRAQRLGCALPVTSRQRLLEYAGNDLERLLGELEKLCAFALGSGKTEITVKMVEDLVPKSVETTVYKLSDALVAGNFEQTYRLLQELLQQKEKPTRILAILAQPYMDMYRVRAAEDSGQPLEAISDYTDDYKGSRSFLVERARRAARRVPTPVLHRHLRLLLEADLALKSSPLDDRVILDSLIARMLVASSQEGSL